MSSYPNDQSQPSTSSTSIHSHSYSGSIHANPSTISGKVPISTNMMHNNSNSSPKGINTAGGGGGYSIGSSSTMHETTSFPSQSQRQSITSFTVDGSSSINGAGTTGGGGGMTGTSAVTGNSSTSFSSGISTGQSLIASITQRLVKRLPHNTGETLVTMERDELVRSSVANLVSHSRFQLAIVLRELLQVLESLNKMSQTIADERVVLELMQSQLFMLQVLVTCLIRSWKTAIKDDPFRKPGAGSNEFGIDSIKRAWNDPPPLDDGLAKQVMATMTFFLRQMSSREDGSLPGLSTEGRGAAAIEKLKGKEDDGEGSVEASALLNLALSHGTGMFVLHPSFPAERPPFEIEEQTDDTALPSFISGASQSIISPQFVNESDSTENTSIYAQSIYRQAAQVLFFISSSNWPIVFARIRNRLTYLSTTTEESPSTSELRLIECSNVQKGRLSSILHELTGSFPHLKKPAQFMMAQVLRRCIWSWIQYNPAEYALLFSTQKRLEGGPEVLFDLVYPMAESTRKKHAFWPMLTSLLLLCPDSLSKIAIGDVRKSTSLGKKGVFLDALRKGLRNSKVSDIAAICCIDICKAATCTATSEAGLRLIANDLEGELQERIFEQRKMLNITPQSIEVPMMVDLFVSFFRLDPQRTVRDLVHQLMNDNQHVSCKIILVKAMIQLASEKDRLPWHPKLSLIYPHVSVALRATFKELVFRMRKAEPDLSVKRGKNKPSLQDENVGRQELLSSILQLWFIDIETPLYGLREDVPLQLSSLAKGGSIFDDDLLFRNALQVDNILAHLYSITRAALLNDLWSLNQRAGNLIDRCLSRVLKKSSKNVEACLAITTDFSRHLAEILALSNSPIPQRHWVTLLQASLHRKVPLFLSEAARSTNEEITKRPYLPSFREIELEQEMLEKALLLTICSVETSVCSAGLRACGQLARYRRQATPLYTFSEEWTKLYEELGSLDTIQTGRIAQQKRIRACLREAPFCSNAIIQAWREAYARWGALTLVVARPLVDDASNDSAQDKAAQWHNFAGFLAALGGACAIESWPSTTGNSSTSERESPLQFIETFVQEMVDLLVSDSIWVREKVKETLGSDTSPRLNGVLLRMIHSVLSDFFDKGTGQPRPSDVYTVFVEHSITVIQMVLGRMTEASEATINVDVGALMVLYVEYLNAISKRDQAARIRTSMCQLCETFMQKKNFFTFANEVRVRNRLFQVLSGWTTESIEESSSSEKVERLQRELDIVCLRTMSILLDKLPLLLPEDTPLLDETVEWAKSRQFSTYFTYFIKVLNRAKAVEENTTSTDYAAQSTMKNKDVGLRDVVRLKRSAILALSNLLASNIEMGLHQSLPLAYQEDVQLRSAFMQIMTNVLNQGTAFDQLERLNANEKPNKLIDLICEHDMQLALSICNVCKGYDDGGMDYILLNIFDSRGGIIRFLKAALHEEIDRTQSEEMVFRSNTFRTHLLSAFGKTHGYEYLRTIIAPLIKEMANKPAGYSYEIDQQKLDPGENVLINQHRLQEMAQAFIDQICSSAHRVPAVLRELCRHIRDLMDTRFPNSRYQGVGGFIFLRFINPAVVAPQVIDVNMSNASKELRRGLLLISKILQTLASNTLFPQHKEPFMTSLNAFLKDNVWKITAFLDQVSDTRTDPDRLSAADQPLGFGIHPFGYGIDNEDQMTLHRFVYDNMDKIGKDLLTRTAVPSPAIEKSENVAEKTSPTSSVNGVRSLEASFGHPPPVDSKKIYEQLCIVLADLGDCKTIEDSMMGLGTETGNRQILQDFMRKFQGKNVDNDVYKKIFREGPPSKTGRPVFYVTMSHMASKTLDFETFICYVISTLQSGLNQPFDMVFDCTSTSPSNLIPHQWMRYFASMVPAEIASNLRMCIGYNINTACKLWCRPWKAQGERVQNLPKNTIMRNVQSNLAIQICNSVTELENFIDRRNIALDPGSVTISTAKEEAMFDQITMVWYYRALVPVTFKLSENNLQIQSLKAQPILPNVPGMINEVFHLADIDDVRAISIRGDDNTFFVTCRGGSASFLFNSPNRAEIVQALRQARARVSRYDNYASRIGLDRTLLPSDVPGTLLNMAMLNIMSRDMQLRTSAYDLLCALSSSFNFGESKARNRLLSAKGIALSANTMSFVAELSKDFAIAAPGVTLEFLLSFFEGFERSPTSQKVMCLQYMAPWLSNLVMFVHTGREQQREYQKRIKEILAHLIAITVKESEMYAVMQRSIWSLFTKLDDLIPTILEVFSEAAMDSGLHTERFEAVLDTMVSFNSINLRGKLLSKLRRAITKTSQFSTVGQLHENAAWKEIATLMRMNMVLSFSNKLETQIYLPELLHTTLLLAGTGDNATRFAVHGTVVNMIHSLCTEDSSGIRDSKGTVTISTSIRTRRGSESDSESPIEGRATESSATKLESLLHRLSDNESLALFGLPPADGALLALTSDVSPTAVRESPSIDEIAKLAMMLFEITELAAPTLDTANAWRSRMTSLVTSKAFQYNPVIQARAFILLGCLADLTGSMLESQTSEENVDTCSTFEVDDDLLYQILVSLRGSILEWSSIANDSPIVSIVTCLSKVVKILPDQSRYLAQMFWLGVSIIQYGHIPLFKSGVDLMNATVKSICSRRLFERKQKDLITFLLDGRFDFREAACRLDDETGVDFEINFGFGLAALLVKGLRHPTTCDATIDLLQTMLRNTSTDAEGKVLSRDGRVSIEQLGFFIALLPTATKPEEFGKLLQLAGVSEVTVAQAIEQRKRGISYSITLYGQNGRNSSSSSSVQPPSPPDGENPVGLYKYLAPMENKIALLVVTLLSALLQQSSVSDAERKLLFNFLADSARQVPAIVSILYEFLLPNMREVYLNSQNESIVRSVDVIAQIATSEPIFQLQVQETKRRGGAEAYLDESGYACLLDCGSFIPLKEARRVALAKLSAALLSGLIDAGTA